MLSGTQLNAVRLVVDLQITRWLAVGHVRSTESFATQFRQNHSSPDNSQVGKVGLPPLKLRTHSILTEPLKERKSAGREGGLAPAQAPHPLNTDRATQGPEKRRSGRWACPRSSSAPTQY